MTQIPGPVSAKLNAALINVINHTCAFPVKMSAMEKDPLTGSVIADRPEAAVKKKKKTFPCMYQCVVMSDWGQQNNIQPECLCIKLQCEDDLKMDSQLVTSVKINIK